MHRATNRDFYEAKLANAKDNPKLTFELLQQSPHRRHRKKLFRIMELGKIMAEQTTEKKIGDKMEDPTEY